MLQVAFGIVLAVGILIAIAWAIENRNSVLKFIGYGLIAIFVLAAYSFHPEIQVDNSPENSIAAVSIVILSTAIIITAIYCYRKINK